MATREDPEITIVRTGELVLPSGTYMEVSVQVDYGGELGFTFGTLEESLPGLTAGISAYLAAPPEARPWARTEDPPVDP